MNLYIKNVIDIRNSKVVSDERDASRAKAKSANKDMHNQDCFIFTRPIGAGRTSGVTLTLKFDSREKVYLRLDEDELRKFSELLAPYL